VGFDAARRHATLELAALGVVAVLFGSPFLPAARAAEVSVAAMPCAQGVCGFNVLDAALIAEPCTGASVQAFFLRAGGLAAIRCSDSPDREATAYVFDRRKADGPVYEVEGARLLQQAFLADASASAVPDRFAAVPLCRPTPVAARTKGAAVWLALKVPDTAASGGSCYRVLRATMVKRGAMLTGDDGVALAEAPSGTRERWAPLVSRLLPFMRR